MCHGSVAWVRNKPLGCYRERSLWKHWLASEALALRHEVEPRALHMPADRLLP